jgi:hypothetical protein
MSIVQTKTVDFISTNKDGRVTLTVSDHLEWGDKEHFFLLQEKLNSYLRFIESGEIYKKYPKAFGKDLAISIRCKFEPNTSALKFLDSVKTVIEKAGVRFEYSTFTDNP